MIGIINYGVGNLASVKNAFEHLGHDTTLCSEPQQILACDRLILPGVGSFRAGMTALHRGGWVKAIRSYAESGRPFMGICLGMQLLFDRGEEHGPSEGLGLLSGEVVKLCPSSPLKVPHVGWNSLIELAPHPLMVGVKPLVDVYFVHSYHCVPSVMEDAIAKCNFGGEFVAAAARANVVGVQFHPEKSQPMGVRILENFADWDGKC